MALFHLWIVLNSYKYLFFISVSENKTKIPHFFVNSCIFLFFSEGYDANDSD